MFRAAITPEMHYDDWAAQYDGDMKGWEYRAPERVLKGIVPVLRDRPGPLRMLDAGIGTGLLSRRCRAICPDMHITGIDISTRMLERCARRGGADVLRRVEVGRDRFPFADGAFDIVAAAGLMENVGAIGPALAEMGRVLRPGGVLAFTYMPTLLHPRTETLAKKLRPGRTAEGRLVMGDLNLFRHNPDNVTRAARKAGVLLAHRERFVGYRTYVLMTVRYDLFVGNRIAVSALP